MPSATGSVLLADETEIEFRYTFADGSVMEFGCCCIDSDLGMFAAVYIKLF